MLHGWILFGKRFSASRISRKSRRITMLSLPRRERDIFHLFFHPFWQNGNETERKRNGAGEMIDFFTCMDLHVDCDWFCSGRDVTTEDSYCTLHVVCNIYSTRERCPFLPLLRSRKLYIEGKKKRKKRSYGCPDIFRLDFRRVSRSKICNGKRLSRTCTYLYSFRPRCNSYFLCFFLDTIINKCLIMYIV